MKERLRLEKAKKTTEKAATEANQTPKGQQKGKNKKDGTRPKNQKSGNQSDEQAEQKQKEREEKRKKKEDEQIKQKFQREARKAQAVGRWSAVGSDSDSEITIFRPDPNAAFMPQPIRRQNVASTQLTSPTYQAFLPCTSTSSSSPTAQMNQPPSNTATPANTILSNTVHPIMPTNTATPPNTPTAVHLTAQTQRAPPSTATPVHPTTPVQRALPNTATPVHPTVLTQCTPPSTATPVRPTMPSDTATPLHQTMPAQCTEKTPAKRKQATTPGKALQSKRACNPRRGIHFQNVMGDSSNDEDSEESDEDWNSMSHEGSTSSSSYCKEQKLENEALRKRLGKVHRRLNIACKSWVDSDKLIFLLN